MSLSIGELVGYVSLDTSGVRKGASTAAAEAKKAGIAAANGWTVGADGKLRDAQGKFVSAGEKAAAGLDDGMQKGMSFGWLGKAVKAVTLGLGAAGVAGAVMGTKTAASMEQARISFTTMLGSAKEADSFLRDLADFAAATPFEFPELQTAASSLISAGIEADKVIPIMTTLGDVTAGMGTGSEGIQRATVALQQMQAAGKITGEDLNQLRDAGIPVYDLLASATGKSKEAVVKLAQAGKLGKKELGAMMKALETGKGLERFNGLMEKQSKSLSGMWSSFTDTINMKLAAAITPLIPLMKDGLGGATEFLSALLPKLSAGLQAVVGATVKAVKWAQDHETTIKVVSGVLAALTAIVMAHSAAMAVAAAGGMAAWLKGTRVISAAIKVWTAVQWALNAALAANPLVLLGALLAAVAVGLVIAYKKSETFRNIVNGAFQAVKNVAGKVLSWLGKAVAKAIDFVRKHWKKILVVLGGPLAIAVALVVKHWDKIKSFTAKAIDKVVGFVKKIPGKFKNALSSLAGTVRGVFANAMQAGLEKVRNIGGTIRDWIASIPGRLASLGGKFAAAGRGLLQGFIDGMKNAAGIISGIAGNVWDTVKGLLNGAISRINAALEFTINTPGPGGITINPPNIPALATGGRATSETLAVIGEGREPESVLPDSVLRGLLERAHNAGRESARGDTRNGPLIGHVTQAPGESTDVLAERLWLKLRTRG